MEHADRVWPLGTDTHDVIDLANEVHPCCCHDLLAVVVVLFLLCYSPDNPLGFSSQQHGYQPRAMCRTWGQAMDKTFPCQPLQNTLGVVLITRVQVLTSLNDFSYAGQHTVEYRKEPCNTVHMPCFDARRNASGSRYSAITLAFSQKSAPAPKRTFLMRGPGMVRPSGVNATATILAPPLYPAPVIFKKRTHSMTLFSGHLIDERPSEFVN